jgi:integrase
MNNKPMGDTDASSSNVGAQRMGIMDLAWFHLMLHCGLRVGEVRRLRLSDLDLAGRRARIEQSKGLKDRMVFLSQPAVQALNAYLEIRGPANTDHVFIFRHRPLSTTYCRRRLRTYGRRCGVIVIPHQLRHSCATLLLNAGAPILAVKTILGHKQIDTTMGYARLYDGTLATNYYRAMAEIESRFGSQDASSGLTPNLGQMLALLDVLRSGTLNETQKEAVQTLRSGILALAGR